MSAKRTKPGLHAERLARIARIVQTIRDIYLSGAPYDIEQARSAATTALKELTQIVKELNDG